MRKLTVFMLAATLLLAAFFPVAAEAEIPRILAWQGVALDSTGAALADGSYTLTFHFYDAAAGGTSLWTESQVTVVVDGIINVLLGAVNPVPDSVFADTVRYLEVQFESETPYSPRTRISSVGFAYRTGTVDGATGGRISGQVSIGQSHTNNGVQSSIGGGSNNLISSGTGSVISGGSDNVAWFDYATVGGGQSNSAESTFSTVSGGHLNSTRGWASTIGGGESNEISCCAVGSYATIGGGLNNLASGDFATIPGGESNVADTYGFAAGRNAKANHRGAFVWGDSFGGDVTSSAVNQFTARTSGGARFFSDSAQTTGVSMAPGGGSWTSASDRNLKSDFEKVDVQSVLARVAAMPMTTWNYNTEDVSIRHMGVMAQDFYAAFGLGTDDKHIATIDADGVALAAIQGLNERIEQKDAEIAALRTRLEMLEQLVETALVNYATDHPKLGVR